VSEVLHVGGVVLPEDERRDLYVVDGAVTYEPEAGATTVATGWVVPGLVDMHCHIGLGPDGGVGPEEQEQQALTDRDAGTLLARDCGVAADTRWIDEREDLPRIIRAGRHLARPKRYLRNYGHEVEPEELAAAAEQMARYGDGWVKIVGDWIDRERGDLAPCWPREALAAAIARAHAAGARVTTHTFGEEALPDLLVAGIDCIEHGTGLSADLIGVMAERGVGLVPTLINIETFPSIADGAAAKFPAYADHMRALHGRAGETVRTAYEAGVPIFAGTDAGGGIEHGRIADEVRALHTAGLPAADALGAASWGARAYLGRPCLEEGASADLVVFDTDPREDLSVVTAPARILLRGRVVR